jgi:hypothetical protein
MDCANGEEEKRACKSDNEGRSDSNEEKTNRKTDVIMSLDVRLLLRQFLDVTNEEG